MIPIDPIAYSITGLSAFHFQRKFKAALGRSETVTEALYEAEGSGVEISYVILSTPLGQILIAATGCGRRWRGNIRLHHTPRGFVDCGGKEN